MDQNRIEATLAALPLGPIRFYDSAASTNDLARDWARLEAPDLSLVVADEQTAGKGRSGRSWSTPSGTALAFSLVLRPGPGEDTGDGLPHLGGVAGLAVASALKSLSDLQPEIKWPNDVLLNGRKVCGILIETDWDGAQLQSVVLGIGVNVLDGSHPPPGTLRFPATCLESELGSRPDRLSILAGILHSFLEWRHIPADEVIRAWDAALAYRGRSVRVSADHGGTIEGRLEGLNRNGSLRLRLPSGEVVSSPGGDLSLRLVDSLPE